MSARRRLGWVLLPVLLAGWIFWGRWPLPAPPPLPVSLTIEIPATPLIGESILRDYAKPDLTLRDDLASMHELLLNFQTLVKHSDALPLGGNAEIAAALRGQSRQNREAFLPEGHPAFNPAGDFVDRWGTPLVFHAESRDRVSIRSAGPDTIPWTEDDLTRGTDGVFRQGE